MFDRLLNTPQSNIYKDITCIPRLNDVVSTWNTCGVFVGISPINRLSVGSDANWPKDFGVRGKQNASLLGKEGQTLVLLKPFIRGG